MLPIQLFDPASCTYTYILFDEATRDALIIDPTDEQIERDLAQLRTFGLKLAWTLETHTHADHITSAGMLAEHTGALTAAPEGCGIATAAVQLKDGDTLRFGGEQILALHTPGHTAGSMCYVWRDQVFTGDTLLIDGCGRTDFQSGSSEAMYHSVTKVLFAPPKRIDEAVPANLTSGIRHDAGGGALLHARPAAGYAGDVSPQLAFKWWRAGDAVLIDVRTDAEREWVGFIPGAVPIAWKQWPGMVINNAFDDALRAAVPKGKKAVLLCRSGVRSIAAARRATELGIEAYNVLEGFEGDPDEHAQRGRKSGWRVRGLPWRQG